MLSAEALVKDSEFFERLLDELRPLGYKTLHDVLADGGLFDILSTLYKCFTFAIGRSVSRRNTLRLEDRRIE